MKELKIFMPPDFSFVPGVRSCIARIASNFGFDERQSYHIETVVDEVCNNAIEHNGRGRNPKIILSCRFYDSFMELIIKDSGGKEFNVEEVFRRNAELLEKELTSGDISGRLRRGRGLIIIKKLVDKLDIKVSKSGTIVRIVKRKNRSPS